MLNTATSSRVQRGGRVASVLSRRGDILVSETQRSRMLTSAVQVIAEGGYGEMSVSRVTAGAGVSRRTFYDLFEDREDCFLAAFDDGLARAREALLAGCEGKRGWRDELRGGLFELLVFFDREPGVRRLLICDALTAGPRVQTRRVEVLGEITRVLHEAGCAAGRRELPELIGEGVLGAVLGVLHTRLLAPAPGSLLELLSPLMGVIVLPYLGVAAAHRELDSPIPEPLPVPGRGKTGVASGLAGLPMRITYRTLLVLAVVAERPGASNREIADAAEVADQGQISRLLARLERLGLIENRSPGQPSGEPNEWHLTPTGQHTQHTISHRRQIFENSSNTGESR